MTDPVRRLARLAVLLAMATVIHTVEALLPVTVLWFRFGFANIIGLATLCLFGFKDALVLTLGRIVLGSLATGQFGSPAFILSLAGGMSAIAAMGLVWSLTGRPGTSTERLGAAADDRIGLGRSACSRMAGGDGSTQIRSSGDRCERTAAGSCREAGSEDKSSRLGQDSNRSSMGRLGAAADIRIGLARSAGTGNTENPGGGTTAARSGDEADQRNNCSHPGMESSRGSSGALFSEIGISIIGAVFHNLGQLAAAYLVLVRSEGILLLLPFMWLAAVGTGLINGLAARFVMERVRAASPR